eukprot:CAMPEP_0176427924 /NCGR_PEP_ID=MMETSP0127-20121128/12856_1 /TAXON_ID=938130 /ORGANISM="Platyophrya macrostoma, Strain WH" /LENGTH=63 /DNA_ID=CAMNT_0017809533 /DNA_START=1 /DNA_END=192 /DNA_ORIENTATION=-
MLDRIMDIADETNTWDDLQDILRYSDAYPFTRLNPPERKILIWSSNTKSSMLSVTSLDSAKEM